MGVHSKSGYGCAAWVAALFVFLCTPAVAAENIFLNLTGIVGPSTSRSGGIDVLSATWSESPPNQPLGSGYGIVTIVKFHDITSANLFLDSARGSYIQQAVVAYNKPVGTTSLDFLTVTLLDVRLAGYQLSASSGASPLETIVLTFSRIRMSFSTGSPATSTTCDFNYVLMIATGC